MRGKPRWKDAAVGESQHEHVRFALRVHGRLAGQGDNTCFSPYSVASALSLLALAARGDTAAELSELLAGSTGGLDAHALLLRQSAELAATQQDSPILDVANTLYTRQGVTPSPGFREELAGWAAGDVRPAPFHRDPEAARQLINADVRDQTHGLIPELLAPGTVYPDTAASLVNALYLRVRWRDEFVPADTYDGEFHTGAEALHVPMMTQTESLPYNAQGGWQAVGLPAGGGVQAVVLLPDGDLAEREPGLDAALLGRLLGGMTERTLELHMPRLRLDMRSRLDEVLRSLGVRTVFTKAADLSGISSEEPIMVDSVQHQAVLRLDEHGLEGAAATAVTARLVAAVVSNLVVRVDRPFLLLVRNATTGAVYFLSRVVTP